MTLHERIVRIIANELHETGNNKLLVARRLGISIRKLTDWVRKEPMLRRFYKRPHDNRRYYSIYEKE